MLALLTTQGNQPQYVTAYARGLLERKEFAEAEQWIDRLEEAAPDGLPATQLRAEVQFRTGKVDEALATWTKFIEKAPRGSVARLARMRAAATQLEALGTGSGNMAGTPAATTAREKSESLFRQYVEEDPKQGLVLVGFLGRQKRFDEALKLMEGAWKRAEPPQIALSCQQLLVQPGITPSQACAACRDSDRSREETRPSRAALGGHGGSAGGAGQVPRGRSNLPGTVAEEPAVHSRAEQPGGLVGPWWPATGRGPRSDRKRRSPRRPQFESTGHAATVYLSRGETDKALADLNELVAQGAGPQNYFHLALAQRKAGRTTEAADSLKKARDLKIRPGTLHPLERPAYDELVRSML